MLLKQLIKSLVGQILDFRFRQCHVSVPYRKNRTATTAYIIVAITSALKSRTDHQYIAIFPEVSHSRQTQELLAVPGIGLSTVEKYGTEIYRVLSQNGG